MYRRLAALALVALLSACGGTREPPRNLDNACSIVTQRPNYLRAFKRTEAKWGVPVAVQMSVIYYESSFRSNARPPHRYALGVIPMGRQSSALGYAQALDGTWADYMKAQNIRRADRTNIRDATDFMGWYMTQTERRNGISKTDARNQYLAYHEGHAGYARGSYTRKAWLMRVASNVQTRAQTYDRQLRACGKI